MLLFKPYHVAPILSDEKDWTRRLWANQRIKPWSLQLAKTQMMSKEFFAVLQILGVRQERLTAITEDGAQREGGYTRREFLDLFRGMHKLAADADPLLFAIQFVRVPNVITVEKTAALRRGDRVVLAGYYEVLLYPGRVFTVDAEPYRPFGTGPLLCGVSGLTSAYLVDGLRKVTLAPEVPA